MRNEFSEVALDGKGVIAPVQDIASEGLGNGAPVAEEGTGNGSPASESARLTEEGYPGWSPLNLETVGI